MDSPTLFFASTPLIALQAAAHALQRPGPHRLVLIEDFDRADRLQHLLETWPDCPFERIERLPGRVTEAERGGGDRPRTLAAAWRRVRVKRQLRRQTLASIASWDATFRPTSVWVGNDRKVETQYALHLASTRMGRAVGHYLDDGLYTYLGDVRSRPWVRAVDQAIKRGVYGRWWVQADQAGTAPWIAEAWLAFPAHARDQSTGRVRHAVPPALFHQPALLRLALHAARTLGVDRPALRRADLVLVLPHSNQFASNAGLVDGLVRLVEAMVARGVRVALKYHPRERDSDPGGLHRQGTTFTLPALLPVELLLPLLPRGAVIVGEGSTALLAARWLRPDLQVHDLGFSRDGYAVRARDLFEAQGIGSLHGDASALADALGGADAGAR